MIFFREDPSIAAIRGVGLAVTACREASLPDAK